MEHRRFRDRSTEGLKMASLLILIITSCSTTITTQTKTEMKNVKQKIIIKTAYTYDPFTQVEKSDQPSLTIEGEAYTIREIFEKHAQGMMPINSLPMQFDEEPDFEDADFTRQPHIDLTDIDKASEEVKEIESVKASKIEEIQSEAKKVSNKKRQELDSDLHGDEGTNKKSGSSDEVKESKP